MASVTNGTPNDLDPPADRSRNAKAQARHRAKRKAYIDQLEQTVTKLQVALGFTPEQVAALPPPLLKIRELEQENSRLHNELDEMRRLVGDGSVRTNPTADAVRHSPFPGSGLKDSRSPDREFKRQRLSDAEIRLNTGNTSQVNGAMSRPPIPSDHFESESSGAGASSLFILGPTFQIPSTPSGSSGESSPQFSQPNQVSQIHQPLHIHRHSLPNYRPNGHYEPVKVEDTNYSIAHAQHNATQTTQQVHYSQPSYPQTVTGDTNHWQYSSQPLQR